MPFPEPEGPFQAPGFRNLLLARFCSVTGSQILSAVVGVHVYEMTHRPLSLGLVGLALFLPIFSFSLLSGHVADRFDRRLVAATCNSVQLAAALTLAFLGMHPELGVNPIYASLFVIGTARAFAGPSTQAILPSLVPPTILSSAIAWSSTSFQMAAVVGPSAAGLLLTALGTTTRVYLVSAAFTGIAATLLTALPPRPKVVTGKAVSAESLFAGVRFVFRNKILLGVISLDLFAVLFGGAVALLPIYAEEILHVGKAGFGMLRAAPAVGAALMAIVLARRPLRHSLGMRMFGAVFIFGIATIVFALSKDFLVSLLALAVVGASDMISMVVRQVLAQTATPDEMRGRVGAVNLVFIGASNELGDLESGITAEAWGTRLAATLGGVATCIVVATWMSLFPALRRADTPESAKQDAA